VVEVLSLICVVCETLWDLVQKIDEVAHVGQFVVQH
jgi:hypothetical protein